MAGVALSARTPLLLLLQDGEGSRPCPNNLVDVLRLVLEENEKLREHVRKLQAARSRSGGHGPIDVPDEYLCLILSEVMVDPVIAEDGQTYEREAITTWLAGHGTSPITRKPMESHLIPNRAIKASIERWRQESGDPSC
jgi:hypothetical protein